MTDSTKWLELKIPPLIVWLVFAGAMLGVAYSAPSLTFSLASSSAIAVILVALGVAVTLGIGLRISAAAGAVMMLLMWAAEWPPAQHNSAGEATMSTNPIIDYHVVYALVLITLAATAAGATWGVARWWAGLPIVKANSWLR